MATTTTFAQLTDDLRSAQAAAAGAEARFRLSLTRFGPLDEWQLELMNQSAAAIRRLNVARAAVAAARVYLRGE